jgi:hypothetical protein
MGSHAAGASHEAEILSRLIQPEKSDLRPEVAEYILDLDFRPSDVDRMNELAQKAAAGTLSADESSEIEGYRHIGHFLALMQSKARLSLKRSRAQ